MPEGDIYIPLVSAPDPTSPSRHFPSPLFKAAASHGVLPSTKARQPHLAWPPRLAVDGSIGVVEQASDDHCVQSVALLLSTPIPALIDAPKFGIPDPTHSTTVTSDQLEQIVRRTVPQAQASIGDRGIRDLVRMLDATTGAQGG